MFCCQVFFCVFGVSTCARHKWVRQYFFFLFIWNFLLIFFCFYSNNFILSFYDDNDICEYIRTRKRYLKYQWEEHLEAGGKTLIELCSGEKRFVLLYFIVIDVAWKFFCFFVQCETCRRRHRTFSENRFMSHDPRISAFTFAPKLDIYLLFS